MTDSLLDAGNQTNVDPTKDYLSELVGEGKKFKSEADLARGKFESDQFIEQLKRENEELRSDTLRLKEERDAGAKLQEMIDRLDSQRKQITNSENTLDAKVEKEPAKEPVDLDKFFEAKLAAREVAKQGEENLNILRTKLKEQFGTNQAALNERLNDLGLTEDDLRSVARKSPQAAIKALGLDEQRMEGFQTPPKTTLRNDNFVPKGGPKRTWNYYQELKKKNPNLFYDIKTNIQMQKDIVELGEEFKDGDYKAFGDH